MKDYINDIDKKINECEESGILEKYKWHKNYLIDMYKIFAEPQYVNRP